MITSSFTRKGRSQTPRKKSSSSGKTRRVGWSRTDRSSVSAEARRRRKEKGLAKEGHADWVRDAWSIPGEQTPNGQGKNRLEKQSTQTSGTDSKPMASPMSNSEGGSVQSTSDSINNTVDEDFGSGNKATREVTNQTQKDTADAVASMGEERSFMAKKAPEFLEKVNSGIETYQNADSEQSSEVARRGLESLLGSPPAGVEEQAASMLTKLGPLFSKTEASWRAKRAAKELQLAQAAKIKRTLMEFAKRGKKGKGALSDYFRSTLYHHHLGDDLSQQANGRDILSKLIEKGLV